MATMPVRAKCPNAECKHNESVTHVTLEVQGNAILKPQLVCGNCLAQMKILSPRAWR